MKMTAISFGLVSAALAASFAFGMMVQAKRNSQTDAKKDVRVTGIGGVFFKAHDAMKLAAWYREHLGITSEGAESGAYHQFEWLEKDDPSKTGGTVWAVFPETAKNFGTSKSPLMIDYRVANLERLLAELKSEGVQVEDKIEDAPYGRFGHATDPEGNRFELWEPK
ncbi:MAG TPA: VOC family protein [Candidatus Acidoferrales bacterium]|nr:VOC family protein [Candidatus Acidoferrales bacterium]